MSSRNITLIIIVLLALGGGWWILSSRQVGTTASTPLVANQPSESISPATTSATASEMTISITKEGFSPKQTTIKAGETVTWVNDDTADHQVNSAPHPTHETYPPLNTIGLLKPGEKKFLSFPDPGTYKFHDHLNPTMFGSVTVQ